MYLFNNTLRGNTMADDLQSFYILTPLYVKYDH